MYGLSLSGFVPGFQVLQFAFHRVETVFPFLIGLVWEAGQGEENVGASAVGYDPNW